jgi:osmotically-inducible protein OsmY
MIAKIEVIGSEQDRELEQRVKNYLLSHHIPGANRLAIVANKGRVTISGRLRSFYHKQLCSSCCRRVAGVTRLEDAVTVTAPPAVPA